MEESADVDTVHALKYYFRVQVPKCRKIINWRVFMNLNKTIRVNWKIVTGPPNYKLNSLMDHDLLFDVKDFKIRGLDPKTRGFIEFRSP